MVKRITLSAINEGINGTVFVYGQTGSGKTYTMLGRDRMQTKSKLALGGTLGRTQRILKEFGNFCGESSSDDQQETGVLLHAMHDLFREIEKESGTRTYFLRCAYVEIYNEQVYDLLRPDRSTINESLQLVEDSKSKDFFIRGVTEEHIHSIQDVIDCLTRGELNRHYAETKLNHQSSRSHTVFRVWIKSVAKDAPNLTQSESAAEISPISMINRQVRAAVLNFVDLAGSEKLSSHDNEFTEANLTME